MPKGEYLQYGGQAIIEGVMMRSPQFFAVACRAPNGEIVLQREEIEKTWVGRQKWLRLPFLRGSFALLDAMSLGMRAMKFSTNVQLDDRYQPGGIAAANQKPSKIQEGAIGLTVVFSICFGVFLFVYLPNLLAEYSQRAMHQTSGIQINIVSEIIKVTLFLGYMWAIGQSKDVREVFKYHGAEHKAINTLEHDKPLVLEECLKQSRFHPRCGTSFAIIVLILGLLVFTFVPRYPITGHQGAYFVDVSVRFLIELALLPIIAGIAYELLRLAGKFRNQAIVNMAFAPGIWTQRLTTREPEEAQIEVALASLKSVIEAQDQADGNVPEPAATPPEPAAQYR
jgi:uncharacterized protein YqhQ